MKVNLIYIGNCKIDIRCQNRIPQRMWQSAELRSIIWPWRAMARLTEKDETMGQGRLNVQVVKVKTQFEFNGRQKNSFQDYPHILFLHDFTNGNLHPS